HGREDIIRIGGVTCEINSQADWDALFTHNGGDGSGWNSTGLNSTYIEESNPVTIILNSDIMLSGNTTLSIPPINSVYKDFLLNGNGHIIDANGYKFNLTTANTITTDNVHVKNGTLVANPIASFQCTDSTFTSTKIEVSGTSSIESVSVTDCSFYDCTGPCINSTAAPSPVTISDCYMDNCGRLFKSTSVCRVNFSGIIAENCTGAVLGQTESGAYIIESISDCQLSTSQTGMTAIEHTYGIVGEIADCTITGFDTGIKLSRCSVGSTSDINTITIRDTTITDCITGLYTYYLSGYENATISNLTIEARQGETGTIGYKGEGTLVNKTFTSSTVNFDFNQMPQVKDCHISGFNMGIDLDSACNAVITNCEISDCNSGISVMTSQAAVVDTTLTASASITQPSVGIKSNNMCFLIDCDINGFYYGNDCSNSGFATIIGCKYKNSNRNLIGAYNTEVYNTSFVGGETSVELRGGIPYFYDCIVEGDDTTQSGISAGTGVASIYIYSLERPYTLPYTTYYDNVKQYSDRTVTNGKSEIFNCGTGIDAKTNMYIADTHIHDCETGVKGTTSTNSYGNNLIEDCTDGMHLQAIYKYTAAYAANGSNIQADTHVDTIRNCSNDGLNSGYITANPAEWKNRLEIYNCGNYGINLTGSLANTTVDVHDCKTGVYADATSSIIMGAESKIYDNDEWNVYADFDNNKLCVFNSQGQPITLTDGGIGNVYAKCNQTVISATDLYSDDSVYYLGASNTWYAFNVNNLYGTVVFDAPDSGYVAGRRVAGLNEDYTPQMFAKKEGWVITTEMNGTTMYAILAEGCDVTYDVTTNGGDTFSDGDLTTISYLRGKKVDLTYTASKTGYEFVGWNTASNATEELDTTLTAGQADITLYAIYKKDCDITYHTYDAAKNYKAALAFYNNQDKKTYALAAYNAGENNTFVGYVLDADAVISSADDVLTADDDITVTPEGVDVYCVYEKQGQLEYLNKDGAVQSTEQSTVYQVMSNNKEFVYTLKAGEPIEGFTFTGWTDEDGNSYAAGSTLSTEDATVVLTPVYKVNDEPTTENPTDTPTTENPTDTPTTENPTDTPTTENPTPQPPTIEPPTAQPSAPTSTTSGPKTGDGTNPIGVIGLGILSLLSMLGLSLKNKRKWK
ncbi:MAG: InlB B-repeat-containing protein, partial [Ruminococcus sp.]|nr:InlB B-repeat-containing protein [Ruminococcus sp.]